jgi:DNA-binding GntR family transcriptional regulator
MDGQLAYDHIASVLRKAIVGGTLVPGQILLEGPIAGMFRSSRSPVRQALSLLREEGLLNRFEGRGLIVGSSAAPRRDEITTVMLGLGSSQPEGIREPAWRRVYDHIERDLIYASVLDPRRINEFELARHYEIGRSVAGQVLNRAEANGIVTRDEAGRWSTVLLDAARIRNLYTVRRLLEPEAVSNAAGRDGDRNDVRAMEERLISTLHRYPDVRPEDLDALETDLHVDCVERNGNEELARALLYTRCTIIISKHALGDAVAYPDREPFMDEHLRIVRAILAGDGVMARSAMADHLMSASEKVVGRLDALRRVAETTGLPYLS